jgi:ribosomal protein S17
VSANEGDGIEIITDPLTKEKFWVLPGGVFEPIKPKIIKEN